MYEELIDRLRNLSHFEIRNAESVIHVSAEAVTELREIAQEAANAIEELSKPRWVPVTERLPEEKHAVIVWEPKYLNHYICVLSEGEWYVFGGYGVKVFGVTHWMPLPPSPKEET